MKICSDFSKKTSKTVSSNVQLQVTFLSSKSSRVILTKSSQVDLRSNWGHVSLKLGRLLGLVRGSGEDSISEHYLHACEATYNLIWLGLWPDGKCFRCIFNAV